MSNSAVRRFSRLNSTVTPLRSNGREAAWARVIGSGSRQVKPKKQEKIAFFQGAVDTLFCPKSPLQNTTYGRPQVSHHVPWFEALTQANPSGKSGASARAALARPKRFHSVGCLVLAERDRIVENSTN
jgi:hypothetical protein